MNAIELLDHLKNRIGCDGVEVALHSGGFHIITVFCHDPGSIRASFHDSIAFARDESPKRSYLPSYEEAILGLMKLVADYREPVSESK